MRTSNALVNATDIHATAQAPALRAVILATTRDVIVAAPVSFIVGVVVGMWLASFYRIVKRNGK